MKDAYKRKIRRLEEELMAKDKELELLKTRIETESAKLAVAEVEFTMESHLLVEAREAVVQAETDAEDARSERGGVQTENEELRQTISREQEDRRRERAALRSRAQELEAMLSAARQSGHDRLSG